MVFSVLLTDSEIQDQGGDSAQEEPVHFSENTMVACVPEDPCPLAILTETAINSMLSFLLIISPSLSLTLSLLPLHLNQLYQGDTISFLIFR